MTFERVDYYSPEAYAKAVKSYHAFIGSFADPEPAKRVSVYAVTLEEAEERLAQLYGADRIMFLGLDSDWQLPR